jgi:hypothetical protein
LVGSRERIAGWVRQKGANPSTRKSGLSGTKSAMGKSPTVAKKAEANMSGEYVVLCVK